MHCNAWPAVEILITVQSHGNAHISQSSIRVMCVHSRRKLFYCSYYYHCCWLYDDACNNFFFQSSRSGFFLLSLLLQMSIRLICLAFVSMQTKRKSHLNESNHNSLSIFNRQCRCQLKCRWLLAVSVHFPSIMIAIISINVNDSHINNSNSVLIHLLHGIDRVNDSFGLSNQMENVFGCVCVCVSVENVKNRLETIERKTESFLINTFLCALTHTVLFNDEN